MFVGMQQKRINNHRSSQTTRKRVIVPNKDTYYRIPHSTIISKLQNECIYITIAQTLLKSKALMVYTSCSLFALALRKSNLLHCWHRTAKKNDREQGRMYKWQTSQQAHRHQNLSERPLFLFSGVLNDQLHICKMGHCPGCTTWSYTFEQ